MSKKVRIYSNEHQAWWRPDYCGYTEDKTKAGIFDYDKAVEKYPYIDYDRSKEDFFIDLKVQPEDLVNYPEAEQLRNLFKKMMSKGTEEDIENSVLLTIDTLADAFKDKVEF